MRRGEWDGDSIGLCGVRGERTLNLDPRSECGRTNACSSCVHVLAVLSAVTTVDSHS